MNFEADLSGTQTEKETNFYRKQLDDEPIPVTAPDIWNEALNLREKSLEQKYDKDAIARAKGLVVCSKCNQEYFAVDKKLHRCIADVDPTADPNDLDYLWSRASEKCKKCGLEYLRIARKCYYCKN